ncbi:MAG TPA: N-acetylmuramoyl-L-alanine amidase [Actinomycetota bacterium]|jgi:hypothetical protein|nr:N-acetylmuramoyl-L-alanine amidase [Actinomycetota bacterium]
MGGIRRLPAVTVLVSLWTTLLVLGPVARAMEVPATMARSVSLGSSGGVARLPLPATHLGFSWEGAEKSGVRFRLVNPDGSVGSWTRAPEAHDAERGIRHFSGVIAVSRPEAIEWEPVVPRRGWIRNVALDALNTVDGPTRTIELPAGAAAAPPSPRVITRAEWGADESLKRTTGSCRRTFYDVQQLFVHHTAGSNSDPNPKATMRAIYWFHTVRQGWCDLGYNFVIGSDGRIYEGRWARRYGPWEIHDSEDGQGRAVAGAHASGYNSGSIGISLMGNFQTAPAPEPMKRALAELLAWEADRHGLAPKGRHTYRNPETGATKRLPVIAGHRDAGQTACPGGYLYAALPQIRDAAKAVIGGGKASTATTLSVPTHVDYENPVTLTGAVVGPDGAGLAARRVKIWASRKNRWNVVAETTSGLDGSFATTLTFAANVRLVAVYEGDASTWGSQSEGALLKVRPIVRLAPEGATPNLFGVYEYPSGTTKVTFGGDVRPAHPGGEVEMRVARLNDDTTETPLPRQRVLLDAASSYRYELPVPGPGRYRAVAWFVKDRDHAAAPSEPVVFTVAP